MNMKKTNEKQKKKKCQSFERRVTAEMWMKNKHRFEKFRISLVICKIQIKTRSNMFYRLFVKK